MALSFAMSIGTNKIRLPVVGITMGDAAGIGPEVIIKALSDSSLREKLRPVVIGDARVLDAICRSLRTEIEIAEYSVSDPSPVGTLEVSIFAMFVKDLKPVRFRRTPEKPPDNTSKKRSSFGKATISTLFVPRR